MLVSIACSSITDAPLDPRAELMSPPSVYTRWWGMVEACSGLRGSFESVKWYQVPNSDVVTLGSDLVGGYWAPPRNRIVLAGNAKFNGSLVRHEMLHALVRQTSGHSRIYFVGKCGGIVSCISPCSSDIGSPLPPPSNARSVQASALTIELKLIPTQPALNLDEGMFTVVVTASNQNAYPVVLISDPLWSGRGFFYQLYGPDVTGIGESEGIWDGSQTQFQAGETKVRYFDVSLRTVPGAPQIAPGLYSLAGGFEGNYVTSGQVAVGGGD